MNIVTPWRKSISKLGIDTIDANVFLVITYLDEKRNTLLVNVLLVGSYPNNNKCISKGRNPYYEANVSLFQSNPLKSNVSCKENTIHYVLMNLITEALLEKRMLFKAIFVFVWSNYEK